MKAGDLGELYVKDTEKKNMEPVARRLWILLSKRVILLPVYRFCMDFIRGITIIFNPMDSANRPLCKRLLIFNLVPRVLSYRSRLVGENPGNEVALKLRIITTGELTKGGKRDHMSSFFFTFDTACFSVLKRQRKFLMFNNNTYHLVLSIIFLSVCTLILSSLIVHP